MLQRATRNTTQPREVFWSPPPTAPYASAAPPAAAPVWPVTRPRRRSWRGSAGSWTSPRTPKTSGVAFAMIFQLIFVAPFQFTISISMTDNLFFFMTDNPMSLITRIMKAYVDAKKAEEEEDFPSNESSSSSEEEQEDEEDEEERGGDDVFVVPGFLSDISND